MGQIIVRGDRKRADYGDQKNRCGSAFAEERCTAIMVCPNVRLHSGSAELYKLGRPTGAFLLFNVQGARCRAHTCIFGYLVDDFFSLKKFFSSAPPPHSVVDLSARFASQRRTRRPNDTEQKDRKNNQRRFKR